MLTLKKMNSASKKSSKSQQLLSGQNIVYAGIAWGVVSLLFFLLFSIPVPGEEVPLWYSLGTYILESLPFLIGAWLCYRNWRSPQIASGRNVWLGMGLGMLCFFIGNFIFGIWELYWELDPDVSPADLFYLAFYAFVGWGMFLAVLPRRLNLEMSQWIAIAAIAGVGILFAIWVTLATPRDLETVEAIPSATTEEVSQPTSANTEDASPAPTVEAEEVSEKDLPEWLVAMDNFLSKFSRPVNFFYIVGDVIFLIIASALLLAFWGGRFAQSWRMIAAAAFSLYIADMWFKYAATLSTEYESGSLLEVFFIFSGVLFAMGAALEYDVSSRPTRNRRRRGG